MDSKLSWNSRSLLKLAKVDGSTAQTSRGGEKVRAHLAWFPVVIGSL